MRFIGTFCNTVRSIPARAFSFGFFTNDGENDGSAAGEALKNMLNVNELSSIQAIAFAPATYGTTGFSLMFKQAACT